VSLPAAVALVVFSVVLAFVAGWFVAELYSDEGQRFGSRPSVNAIWGAVLEALPFVWIALPVALIAWLATSVLQ
jgi:hypothetical protein